MKAEVLFRTLYASEIEVRPAHVDKATGKVNLLLYIDSRAVVSLLNETVGNLNWQSNLYEVNGQMIGEIGLYDEKRDIWIWKSDTGSESNIEKEKGLVSDIYKRVLSRWGVTELYSSPKIRVEDDGYGNLGYKVSEIKYNDRREICHLVLVNKFGKEVYRMPDTQQIEEQIQEQQPLKKKEVIIRSDPYRLNTTQISNLLNTIKKQAEEIVILNPNVNTKELQSCANYYTKRVNEGKWAGDVIDFSRLFNSWMERYGRTG